MISVFNIEQLNKLLESFHTVTHIRITVFDDGFSEITAYPAEIPGFCSLIRESPEGIAKCHASDQEAFRRIKDRHRPYIYECPAGLKEAICPLRMNGLVIGYIMFGHIAPMEDMDAGWQYLLKKWEYEGSADRLNIKEEYEKLRYFSPEYLTAAAQLMEAVASYLCTRRMATLKYDTLAVQVDNYITEHLAEDISADRICDHFQISRSKLYQLSEEVYSTGIATHIRSNRIARAKELLTETDLPIQEVARQCGFPDYNYFSKVFKKSTRYTPRDYRKYHTDI